jgi:uncharacterized protein (TIGR02996 family)
VAPLAAQLRARFRKGVPGLAQDDRALCEAVVRFCDAHKTHAMVDKALDDEFFAQIYAAAEDDEPRFVLADRLQERGDPRGEFIALQYARLSAAPSAEALAREQDLFDRHATRWLGSLRPVLFKAGLVFERGFPVEGRLTGNAHDIRRAAGDPAWVTFRALDVDYATRRGSPVDGLLVAPSMRSLRRLVALSTDDAVRLERSGVKLSIEQLVIRGLSDEIAALGAFPRLKRLDVQYGAPAAGVARLLAQDAIARLESFAIEWYRRGRACFTRGPDGTLSALAFDLWGGDGDPIDALADLLNGFRVCGRGLSRVLARSEQPLADDDRDRLAAIARDVRAEIAFASKMA